MPTKWKYTQKTINSIINNVSLECCLTDMFLKPIPFKGRGNFYIKRSPFSLECSHSKKSRLECSHSKKSRPFFISGKRRIFKCFNSGNSGNVISFIMQFLKINKKEAIRFLCVKYDIKQDIVSMQYDDGSDPSLLF